MYFAKTNVSSGRGKKSPGFSPNQRIPDDTFTEEEFNRLIERGAVMRVSKADVTESSTQPPQGASQTAQTGSAKWEFTKSDLEDVALEGLNMLIAQHIEKNGLAKIDPFEDRDEAIMFMTSDSEA